MSIVFSSTLALALTQDTQEEQLNGCVFSGQEGYGTSALRIFRCMLALMECARNFILRYTVLTSPKKGETAVHCCDPTLSVLVMLVSRNVFHVVSALQSIVCLHTFFGLIRFLVDPTLAAFIVCGPLQFLVSHLYLANYEIAGFQ